MQEALKLMLGVLLLTAMAAGHPYSPYSDNRDGTKNTQLSEEEVAAYLRRKMEKDNLEPATIMDYVISLIQGGKKNTTPPPVERNCIPNSSSGDDSLQVSQLETIMDTIHPISGNLVPNLTLVTPDHFATVYDDEFDPHNSYVAMLSPSDVTINFIWTNYAPCTLCVHSLINEYDKPELAKPTIYIGRLVHDSASRDLKQVVRALQCMARLVHEGFEIRAWNINEFKQPMALDSAVFTSTCNTKIDDYTSDAGFNSALSDLSSLVDFIKEIGANAHANTWCST